MVIFCLLPVITSSLLIAAHFYRMGFAPLIFIALLLPLLILVRHRWAARTVQIYLFFAAVEWVRALLIFIEIYERAGMSWTRLAIILGGVALFTFGSAMIFFCRPLKNYFRTESANRDSPAPIKAK